MPGKPFPSDILVGEQWASPASAVVFHPATGLDATAIAHAQVRQRLRRGFVRRGLRQSADARAKGQWEHGGDFSVDASPCVEAADRAGGEGVLRYCAAEIKFSWIGLGATIIDSFNRSRFAGVTRC